MTELLQNLKDARKLITPRWRWTKGSYGRSLLGERTNSFEACRFCAIGAVRNIAQISPSPAETAIRQTCYKLYDMDVERFNDIHSHKEVLALYDETIRERSESSLQND